MAGYVYFFETGDGLVKIGKANNVEARFKQIQTACPSGLKILGSIPSENPYELEKEIHKNYQLFRKSGEWFDIPAHIKPKNAHDLRYRFDERYAQEFRSRKREEWLQRDGYIETSEEWEPNTCPNCGYFAHSLEGVYNFKTSDKKYTHIAIVVECESCNQLHGSFESHGKGGKYSGQLKLIRIPGDWNSLL